MEIFIRRTDNVYLSKLLYTASDCYIRFAVSCGLNEQENKCREEMKQIILEENGVNLDSISRKKENIQKNRCVDEGTFRYCKYREG